MRKHQIFFVSLTLGLASIFSGCRDKFSDLNTDPGSIVGGEINYLFAEAVNQFDPQPYLEYYYNAPMKYQWAGMGLSTKGASEEILTLSLDGDQAKEYLKVLRVVRAMEHEMSKQNETMQETNKPYLAAARLLSIYLGLFATDMYGDIPYIEAGKGAYGETMTPKYDSVKDLYDLWLKQIDESIATLTAQGATIKADQDVVYAGDVNKWARLANSIKLRIAVRLLNPNPTKAKEIAAEVEKAPCGYIDEVSQDFRFSKGKNRVSGDDGYVKERIYHWSNDFIGCAASKTVIDFMVNNKDPRVRFFYKKNKWNSKVIQGYYDAGLQIPDFIEKNVVSEKLPNGKKRFIKWGGLGEPWVRYYGMTEEWMAGDDHTGKYKWYFPDTYANADKELFLHNKKGESPKGYTTYSTINQMMIIGRKYNAADQVSGATLPDDTYTFNTQDRPWYGMYLSAAEVNLYLAEFAMLRNDEVKAKKHYEKALALSVTSYDILARDNQVAYYSNVKGCFQYDKNEGAIDLKEGEIQTMMQSKQYAFTGTTAEKLEKIYIQELLNFTLYPNEVYVTSRRSGYPAFKSDLLPRKNYTQISANDIPRRFPTGAIDESDLMSPNKIEALKNQKLTPTSSGMYDKALANERLWQDTNAPTWGAGR